MTDATMAYVGVLPCGCAVAATVDKPEYAKDNAKLIARWIRDGMTVERRPLRIGSVNIHACIHKDESQAEPSLFDAVSP